MAEQRSEGSLSRRARLALRHVSILAAAALFVLGPAASSPARAASTLEETVAPVGGLIETVTDPVQVPVLPAKPQPSPAPVEVPVPAPRNPSLPPRVDLPDPPAGQASAAVVDQVLETVQTGAGSASTAAEDPQATGESVTAGLEGATVDPGESAGSQASGSGRADATPPTPHRRGRAALVAEDPGPSLRPALVAPIQDLLAYVWPAVALVSPSLKVLLERAELNLAAVFAASGPVPASSAPPASSQAREPGAAAIGVDDWLAVRAPLPALGGGFVPDSPLPLAFFYALLTAVVAVVWCLSRWEVGLRSFSRQRRL